MTVLLSNAGRTFLKAFLSTFIVCLVGISSQPDLHSAGAVAVAGVAASIAAGLAAVQSFVPQLNFKTYVPMPFGPALDSFIHAFLGFLIVALIGALQEPSLTAWKAIAVAAIVGAINAGLRTVQGTLTPGEWPAPGIGSAITPPATPMKRPAPPSGPLPAQQ